ncbi:MAG: hypothetical protein IKG27_03020 [Bacilli bacterium]|nr:hypothetical protein [Bacilli bacterium]
MNLLFEIPDIVIVVIGAIFVLLIILVAFIIRHTGQKVKPIDEDDRYDNDEIMVSEIDDKEITTEQKEAKEELSRVFNRMNADLEKQKEAETAIDEFEKEQEENAIISYQELLEHAEKLKADADMYEKNAEEKADMSVKEASRTYRRRETKKEEKLKKSEVIEKPKKITSFKNSDIVSPIYGVQSNKNMVRHKNSSKKENRDIISKAYEKDYFDEEKTQNLDFLNSLKEFRNKL